jgi:hypothetical protein
MGTLPAFGEPSFDFDGRGSETYDVNRCMYVLITSNVTTLVMIERMVSVRYLVEMIWWRCNVRLHLGTSMVQKGSETG